MKRIISFILCMIMAFSCVCVNVSAEDVLLGDVDGDGTVTTEDAQRVLKMAAGIVAAKPGIADMNSDGNVSVEDAIAVLFEATNIGGVVLPDKNGENFLSDRANNEFIRLIANEYDLDPASLVAIYSVPDSGTNYVLEFGNTGTLLKKEYEKSADNLEKIYHIGLAPERKISYTDGRLVGGDHYNCTSEEGWMVFGLVKKNVLTQYPDYFTV